MGTMVLGCYLSYWFLFVLTYAIFFFFFKEGKKGRKVEEDLGVGGGEGIQSKFTQFFKKLKYLKSLKKCLTI